MTEALGATPERQTFRPYDPAWPSKFEAVAAILRKALPDAKIEHYGSTAVPGLGGRPILDIQVAVPDAHDRKHYEPALKRLGYARFVPPDLVPLAEAGMINYVPADGSNTVHLAVSTLGGFHQVRQLAVRDYLRSSPGEAEAYAEVKKQAAVAAAGVRQRYGAAKAAFVIALQERAMAWLENRRKAG